PSDMDNSDMPFIPDRFKILFHMLDENTKRIPLDKVKPSNKMAHLHTISINEGAKQNNLSNNLFAFQLFHLQQKEYEYLNIEFTNPFAYRAYNSICDKIEYEKRLPY